MPIEIRELIIRVTVQPDAAPPAAAAPLGAAQLAAWQQEMTRACVQQVLAELQQQQRER